MIVTDGFRLPRLHLRCAALSDDHHLPLSYGYSGSNYNPPLAIDGLPASTRSLAIILQDADAPLCPWTHWVCWDLPPATYIATQEHRGINGCNDFQLPFYTGPLLHSSPHRYEFLVYALRTLLHLPAGAPSYKLQKSVLPHAIAVGQLSFYLPH